MPLPQKIMTTPAGSGRTHWIVGNLMTCKVTGAETGGGYSLWESVVPAGVGTPPHIHHNEDEAFYILEGEIEFTSGDETLTLSAGASLHAPRDIVHSYRAITPVRMLVMAIPAGLENFFFEAGREVTPDSPAPAEPTPEDFEKLLATAPKYGLEIFPPGGPE